MVAWRESELLAERIYRELLDLATVKWNDQILGRYSQTMRQIDVSIRWKLDGVDKLTIVQVKDWNRRPDINDVGSFGAVIEDVGASQGIMVSKKGFSKSARTYARQKGIQLHSLHDAQCSRWNHRLTIPVLWTEWSLLFEVGILGRFEAGDKIEVRNATIAGPEGPISVWEDFRNRWNLGQLDRETGKIHALNIGDLGSLPVVDANGDTVVRALEEMRCNYTPTSRHWLGQFNANECRGILDYLQEDAFFVSHLPFSQLPIERDKSWIEISDPNRVSIDANGTLVSMELLGIDKPDSAETTARYLGP